MLLSDAVAALVDVLGYRGRLGVGFPAVVWEGEVYTANNIDRSWIGVDAATTLSKATGCEVKMLNDADAAALGEATFGSAKDVSGLVVMVTFGTGIGSGMILDGQLVPNVELGAIELDGYHPAELYFSAMARESEGLSWGEWGDRANRFLAHVYRFLSPELIVVGGGVAKKWESFSNRIDPSLPVRVSAIGNNAGIVGAALAAMHHWESAD